MTVVAPGTCVQRACATMACAAAALMIVVAGAHAATASATADMLVERFRTQADELESALSGQRTAVLEASEDHDRALVAVRRGAEAQRRLRALAKRAGLAAPAAAVLVAPESTLTEFLGQLQQAEQHAGTELDTATTEAADTQGDVLDARRRADALEAALKGAKANPGLDGSEISYSFGGPGTEPVTAEAIDDYLQSKASPMAGSGAQFVASGVRWRVDPRFVVAIAGAESYFGLKTCASHNAWGWGCPNGPFAFDSWAAGFDTVAKGLRENYLGQGRTTVGEIHLKYAPPNADNDPTGLNYAWPDNVAKFLIEQGGNPQNLEGSGKGGKPVAGVE